MLSYAALVYHLPLLIAFSVSQNTSFVWGGCMLFPLQAMVHDSYGIMQVWSASCHAYTLLCITVFNLQQLYMGHHIISIMHTYFGGSCVQQLDVEWLHATALEHGMHIGFLHYVGVVYMLSCVNTL